MTTKTGSSLVLVFFFLLFSIPNLLNYQGKLVNRDGAGINGTIPITFKLYSSEAGGEPLWTETQNVSIVNGLFSVFLGNVNPFPDSLDFSEQYWLEIVVAGEIMSPRERLVSAPYAIRSAYTTHAIQSVFSDSNSTRRTGNFVFRAGPGATLTDDGSNIYITLGTCGGGSSGATPNIYDVLVAGNDAGGRKIINLANPTAPQDVATKSYVDNQSVSSIVGGAGLVPNDTLMGDVTLDVNVDNSTIEIFDDRLRVKPGGITTTQIAAGAITTDRIATGAVTTEQIASGAITNDKIAEDAVTINQLADFNISGVSTGDILYFNGSTSKWVNLSPGSEGQVLTTHGAGNPPSWVTPAPLAIYNFVLGVEPLSDGVEAGSNKLAWVKVKGVSGERQAVEAHILTLPPGVSVEFDPSSCIPPTTTGICSIAMNISTSPTASRGTFPLTITGVTSGGSQSTATYNISIATVPGAISNLAATDMGDSAILTWSPPDNGGSVIISYIIYRGTSPAPTTPIDTVGAILSYTDHGLSPTTQYYYRVRAVNAIGTGPYSNEVFLHKAIGGDVTIITEGGTRYRVHSFTNVGTDSLIVFTTVTAEVLVVAGGGGGGWGNTNEGGGGGGAGGLLYGTLSLSPGTYPVTVGAGGTAPTSASEPGGNGGNSSFGSAVAIGGGGGGSCSSGNETGRNGGSGGGGQGCGTDHAGGSATQGNSGGLTGYGNAGGTGIWVNNSPGYGNGGGGGGAGGAGQSGHSRTAGTYGGGGAGRSYSITGTSVTYARGGDGGPGRSSSPGINASPSTGNGGTGGNISGSSGGSGIVVVRYPL